MVSLMTYSGLFLFLAYVTLKIQVLFTTRYVGMLFQWSCMDVSWTIKKAEHRRIDAFEQWYWRRLLRVPWIARVSNQSILKEISPEYSLEGLMLKLNLQYFAHLIWRTDSLEKNFGAGKDWKPEEKWRIEDEMVAWNHWLNGQEFEQASGVVDEQGSLVHCSPCGCKESDTT